MRRLLTILATAAFGLAATAARADEILNIGDPAPKLDVSGWVKGEKVQTFEPGKTYVIEFWATWCGPCRQSIPHLTELAHQYRDKGVRFIGVDVWERELSKVKPFVDEMGDRMDYSVALDAVPDKADPNSGAMARNWMAAAEENGIPAAFIVRDGKIAWIGHPMRLDDPLAKVTAGTWDPTTLAKTRLAEKSKERKLTNARNKIVPPYRAGDYRAALSAIEEVTSREPELADEFLIASLKLHCLCRLGETEDAVKLGERLLEKFHDQSGALNNTFFYVVDLKLEKAPDPRIARLALRAARRADELTRGKNIAILDTLAVALYRTGDIAGAIAAEKKAIRELDAGVAEKDRSEPGYQRFRKSLEDNIEAFRKGGAAKGPGVEKP